MRKRVKLYRVAEHRPGAYVMSRWFEAPSEDELEEKVAQFARGKYGYLIEW